MNKDQMNQINELRLQGLPPIKIAEKLDLPAATIRTYIHRHPDIEGQHFCKYCGEPIKNFPARTRFKFCSDKCRQAWYNQQRGISRGPVKKCKYCGKEFKSYGNKQYCSRDCYLNAIRKG